MTLLCIFTSAEQLRYRNINGLLATFECEFICRISFKYKQLVLLYLLFLAFCVVWRFSLLHYD